MRTYSVSQLCVLEFMFTESYKKLCVLILHGFIVILGKIDGVFGVRMTESLDAYI